MYTLNDRISRLAPYSASVGDYDIRLDANESFIRLPIEIIEEATRLAMSRPLNRYPDFRCAEACKKFAEFYEINAENVVAGNGSDELISLITGAFFEKDDLLLTLDFDFSMYRQYAETYGIKNAAVPKNADLTVNVEETIEFARKNNAVGLVFSNPCNPTSLCLKKEDVMRLVDELPDTLIIADEAYMDFANESVIKTAAKRDNLIVLKTCSKAVGLAGIRLGFAAANTRIINALLAVKSPYNVNSLTQSVAEAVLGNQIYLNSCIEKIIRSRDNLLGIMLSLKAKYDIIEKVYETSANFLFIKLQNAEKIYEELKKKSISVRRFGGYLRISVGSKEENAALHTALKEILSAL